MGIYFQDLWTEFLVVLAVLTLFVTLYFRWAYQYWTKKGVPIITPKFPLGNTNMVLPKGFSVGILTKKFYDDFKSRGLKFGGVYFVTEPHLVVVDPDYIKDIMSTDFQYFVNRGFYHNKRSDPLSAHLFAIEGGDWRSLRIKLTPTFTSGKMKMMFHMVIQCSNYMKEAIDGTQNRDIDIKEVMSRFTTDVIGSCAFGIDCNSFKYPDAEFRRMGQKLFEYNIWESVKAFFMLNLPELSVKLGIPSNKKDIQKFFMGTIRDAVKLREENKITRKDFLQLLIELKNSTDFSIDEVSAQAFLFFVAGFETSSTTMSFALYELAKNPEVQEKLRKEVCRVAAKYDDQITYDGIMEMKYLAQVVNETLRMYPPLATLNRRCSKTYTLRDTDITIEKGTRVLISTLGLHMDPDNFPEPEKFDPDRFNDENKKDRHQFVHLPFGDGPRNCIGLRFGEMQSKIGVATVVKNFRLSVSPATKPIVFDPYVFLLCSIDKIYLRAEKV